MKDTTICENAGANVQGDPRLAKTWIANELRTHNICFRADEVITTGTSVVPFY